MNNPTRLLVFLLSLTAIGCALFAYREHARKVADESELAVLAKDRDMLRQRVEILEKTAHSQMTQRPSFEAALKPPAPLPQPSGISNRQVAEIRGEAGLNGGSFANPMDNPEVQKLMVIQQRAALDNRFAALFRELKLSPADLDKFKQLLVDKQTAILDVRTAAQTKAINGQDGREMIREMLTNAQTKSDDSIRAALGDTRFAKYQTYEQTLPERTAVSLLEQRLSYTSSPLTSDQIEKLITILAETSPTRNAPQTVSASFAALRAISSTAAFAAPLTSAAITRSENVLNSEQLTAYRQLLVEQEAKAQLAQQFRSGGGPIRPPGANPLPPATAPAHP